MYFIKKYIEKIRLKESYNNCKIKLKIYFVNRAPGLLQYDGSLYKCY